MPTGQLSDCFRQNEAGEVLVIFSGSGALVEIPVKPDHGPSFLLQDPQFPRHLPELCGLKPNQAVTVA